MRNYKNNRIPSKIGRGKKAPRDQRSESQLFNTHVNHMLKWLTVSFGLDPVIEKSCCRYVHFIEHLFVYKGWSTAIKINKEIRLRVTRWLAGQEIEPNNLRLTYDGLPVKLYDLIPFLKSKDPQNLRGILTILNVTRRVKPKTLKPDITTITGSYTGQQLDFSKEIGKFVSFLRRSSRMSRKSKFRNLFSGSLANVEEFSSFHLSTKTGPTGKQALTSSLCELEILSDPKFSRLLESICILGGPRLAANIELCRQNVTLLQGFLDWPKLSDVKTSHHSIRKITAIPDSEGKTRVVAIGDYWSQTCLYPLHRWIYRCLEMLPQDKTFKQGSDLRMLPFDGVTTYYCFDLSAATDRFPIKIIVNLLEVLLGKEKATAWYDIMVGEAFDFKDPSGENLQLKYSVGNPMGFLSSWASFTLSHHLIMFICCLKARKDFRSSKYMLLGDDIIIYDDRLAAEYRKLIKYIGVEISESKTHQSKNFFEFAKRYFYNGKEISPCSSKGFIEQSKSITSLIEFVNQLTERGWTPIEGIQASVIQHFSMKRAWRAKARKTLFQKVVQANALYKLLRGTGNDRELINTVLVTLHPSFKPLSCNQDKLGNSLIEMTVVQMFADSAEKFTGDLQDRLFNLTLYVTGVPELDDDLITSNPASHVIGKFVEESYIRSMNRAYTIDTIEGGAWAPNFRVLIGANATQILSARNYALVSSVSSIFVKWIRKTISPWVVDGLYG